MVGRGDDLARLASAVGLQDRRGGLAVLSGDAGIGKTRLLAELRGRARDLGWRVAVGHCVGQGGSALPYLPFVELIGSLRDLAPERVDEVGTTHPRLDALLAGGNAQAGSATPAAGRGPADPADPRGEGRHAVRATSQADIAEAVHTLLSSLGGDAPTLLVVEDVHWADPSSRDLITLLLTRGFPSRVGLVVSYRSDDLHRGHPLHETLPLWARLPDTERIALAPLADGAIVELVTELGRAEAAGDIARRSAGNPFFAEELAARDVAGLPPAGGLRRVLQARIDRLSPPAQHVVRAVSLKGGRFVTHDLLARVAGLSEDQFDAAVAEAVEHHVLEASWAAGYAFRHALLGETVESALLPGQRLRLHRAYAEALADRPRLAPAHELARHAAAAGDLPTAIAAGERAAEEAMAVGGAGEALTHLERVLGWLDEDDPARDDTTIRAADAALAGGDTPRSIELIRDRLDHPGRRQPRGARADLLTLYANRARLLDLPVDRGALTREAVALLPPARDERRVAVLTGRLQYLVDSREIAEGDAVAREILDLADELGLRQSVVEVRTLLARVVEQQDDLDAAERQLLDVLADTPDPRDPLRVRMLHNLATIAHRRGDLSEALSRFDAGAAAAEAAGIPWAPFAMECRLSGGLTAYELGDWPGAAARLDLGDADVGGLTRALFESAALLLAAGRGEPVAPGRLRALREHWDLDSLVTVYTVVAGIDLHGAAGAVDDLLDLVHAAVAALDRTWGRYQAIVRIAALLTGQAAALIEAGRVSADQRRRLVEAAELAVARARDCVTRMAADLAGDDPGEESGEARSGPVAPGPEIIAPANRETWAWWRRVEAEAMRLRAVAGDPPDPEATIPAWEACVAASAELGHVYETARARARLAAALRRGRRVRQAAAVAAAAQETANRLGARPLLNELAGPGQSHPRGGDGSHLTPREREVLILVADGLSNGQIGQRLYISTKTVSVHVSSLLAKLDAGSRTEAAAVARARGLV